MKIWILETDRGNFEKNERHGLYIDDVEVIRAMQEMRGDDVKIYRTKYGTIETDSSWRLVATPLDVKGMRDWSDDLYDYRAEWSEEDQVFVARVSEFESCTAHGDTEEQALAELSGLIQHEIYDMRYELESAPVPFRFLSRVGVEDE